MARRKKCNLPLKLHNRSLSLYYPLIIAQYAKKVNSFTEASNY